MVIERLFGYERAALIGLPVERLVPVEARQQHVQKRERYERVGRTRSMSDLDTLAPVRQNGELVPVEISLSPVDTSIGKLTIAIVRDVTRRRALEADLRHASTHDGLTGLFNRTHLESVRSSLEASGQMVGVVADVGGFLGIGDKHVLLPMENVRIVALSDGDDDYALVTRHSEESLKALPEVEKGWFD